MSTPSAIDPDTLLFILRERPGANKEDESLALVDAFEVPLPGGGAAPLAPAWFDLIGDLQLRLVRETPGTTFTLLASELHDLKLAAGEALDVALANLHRRHGEATVQPWHNLQRVAGRPGIFDSVYFADRGFWRARLAEHPGGVVVGAPRVDALLFAPASDTAAVDSMRQGIPRLQAEAGDYRLSSALYLFKDDRWSVLQPAMPAPAAAAD